MPKRERTRVFLQFLRWKLHSGRWMELDVAGFQRKGSHVGDGIVAHAIVALLEPGQADHGGPTIFADEGFLAIGAKRGDFLRVIGREQREMRVSAYRDALFTIIGQSGVVDPAPDREHGSGPFENLRSKRELDHDCNHQ